MVAAAPVSASGITDRRMTLAGYLFGQLTDYESRLIIQAINPAAEIPRTASWTRDWKSGNLELYQHCTLNWSGAAVQSQACAFCPRKYYRPRHPRLPHRDNGKAGRIQLSWSLSAFLAQNEHQGFWTLLKFPGGPQRPFLPAIELPRKKHQFIKPIRRDKRGFREWKSPFTVRLHCTKSA